MQFTGVEHNLEIRINKKNHKTKIKMFTAEQFKILKRESFLRRNTFYPWPKK